MHREFKKTHTKENNSLILLTKNLCQSKKQVSKHSVVKNDVGNMQKCSSILYIYFLQSLQAKKNRQICPQDFIGLHTITGYITMHLVLRSKNEYMDLRFGRLELGMNTTPKVSLFEPDTYFPKVTGRSVCDCMKHPIIFYLYMCCSS